MAFVWSVIVAGTTKILATHANEIMTNANTVADNLGIAHYTWTNLPVSISEIITAVQGQEIRSGLDYLDNNWCPVYYNVYCGSVCGVNKTPNDAAVDVAVYTSADTSHCFKNI